MLSTCITEGLWSCGHLYPAETWDAASLFWYVAGEWVWEEPALLVGLQYAVGRAQSTG